MYFIESQYKNIMEQPSILDLIKIGSFKCNRSIGSYMESCYVNLLMPI